MKIWAIANQKGGVGKTTTTVTLAGILSRRGVETLVVDLDPHGSLTSYFGIDPESASRSVYDLYQEYAVGQADDIGRLVHETGFEHLSILPASTALATIEKQMGARSGMGRVLANALHGLTERFAYVLIDCPPMLGMLMVSALAACDELIIPVQTEHLAIKGLQRMLRTLKMIEKSLNTSVSFTIVPTMYDKRTMASKQSLHRMRNDHATNVSACVIPVDTKFRDASHIGKPLSYMCANTHGLQAYEELMSSLASEFGETGKVLAQ